MVDLQAGLLHAAAELDPKQGHAAQEVLVLHIVLEAQQTLKLQIREAQHADGEALADGVDALHHAAAEPDINIGRAVPEELVLQTAQAVIKTLSHVTLIRAARVTGADAPATGTAAPDTAGKTMTATATPRHPVRHASRVLSRTQPQTVTTAAPPVIRARRRGREVLMAWTRTVTGARTTSSQHRQGPPSVTTGALSRGGPSMTPAINFVADRRASR